MLNDLIYRVRALLGRGGMEEELDAELRFHLDKQEEKLRAAGHSSDEARRLARIALGGLDSTKEACRESRGVGLIETTLQDARYGLRMLRKSPGFTATVALSLALGIGANTAIFTLVNAVMWRALPVKNPEELVLPGRGGEGYTDYGFTYREFLSLREPAREFFDLAGYAPLPVNVSINGRTDPTTPAQLVTGDYFRVLGVSPIAGRAIGPEDDRVAGGHPVVMISYGYWERRFARDSSAVGRTIVLSGRNFTIIGVTPAEFFGVEVGANPDLFIPILMQPVVMPSVENRVTGDPINESTWVRAIARLRPGIRLPEARTRFTALGPIVHAGEDPKYKDWMIVDQASRGISGLRRQFSKPLFLLMAIAGMVLLIACANTATLLLSRAAARQPEFGMRLAIGASRWRLMRQLLVESLLLAGMGGILAIPLARWTTRLLVAFVSIGREPVVLNLAPDGRVLAFTAIVSLLTGVLFGMAPALRAGRANLGQRGGTGIRHALGPGKALAVLQVALSLVLLNGAGLFVRNLQKLNAQDSGFVRDRLLTITLAPMGSDQRGIPGTSARLDAIYKQLMSRIAAMSGVQSVSLAQAKPTASLGFTSRIRLATGEERDNKRFMIYSNYFGTMGIPMVAGRDFGPADLEAHAPMVAIVNEAFATRILKGVNPIGQRFQTRAPKEYTGTPTAQTVSCEIIGVVKNSRYATLRAETPPLIYQPFFQTNTGRGQMTLYVRAAVPAATILPRIRETVQDIDRTLPIFNVSTLADEMDGALVNERIIAMLSAAFGLLALVLVCVGLHGLVAFGAARRTAEVGLRMALGADRRNVVWMILREGLLLAAAGAVIGVPAALAAVRAANGLLVSAGGTDLAGIAAAVAVLVTVGAAASYLPARRASRVDPATALRNE
jgi:predicted permease